MSKTKQAIFDSGGFKSSDRPFKNFTCNWWNDECSKTVEEKSKAYNKFLNNPTFTH